MPHPTDPPPDVKRGIQILAAIALLIVAGIVVAVLT